MNKNNASEIEEICGLKGLSSPQIISQKNSFVSCVLTTTNTDQNVSEDQIALISMQNGEMRIVAAGSSPSWSPNGKLCAFLKEEEGKNGIWIYDTDKEEEFFLTPVYDPAYFVDHEIDQQFKWSPDGKHIAFVSAASEYQDSQEVRVFNNLMYKSKGGRSRPYYAGSSPMSIWLISIDNGEPENLTPDEYHEHSLSWSPDGKKIVFISNRTANPDYNHNNKPYIADVKTKQIEELNIDQATAYSPRWSPDGSHIAYIANTNLLNAKDSPSQDPHLFVKPISGDDSRYLTESLDRRIANIQWHPDNRSIFFTTENKGTTTICTVDIQSGSISKLLDDEFQISEFCVSKNGNHTAYVSSKSVEPPELYLWKNESEEVKKLTSLNEGGTNSSEFQTSATFWFKSFDENRVQGWLTKPANFKDDGTYPLILVIHGGPHNMFGYEFQERTQILSASGYGVLCINPRGSSGYGQEFSRGTSLNWGGGDYKDLMHGVDYICDRYDWIDSDRLGVTGQSYGGFMTNWIITQTKRFKAAVSDGGISNLISFTGTSIFHLLLEDEFDGKPWEKYPLLWQWSPLRNVKNVSTPTLFFHGEKDNEVPRSQTEEMFTALKKLGIETRFVQYVGEGHGWRPDLKPGNKIDLYKRMIEWFGDHIKNDE